MNAENLIKSGAHFGHPVSKWNPQFKKFILSIKNGVHIINMDMTLEYLDKALLELSKVVEKGGNILFVGLNLKLKMQFNHLLIIVACFILLKDG